MLLGCGCSAGLWCLASSRALLAVVQKWHGLLLLMLLLQTLVHVLSKFEQRVCDVRAEYSLLRLRGTGVRQLQ